MFLDTSHIVEISLVSVIFSNVRTMSHKISFKALSTFIRNAASCQNRPIVTFTFLGICILPKICVRKEVHTLLTRNNQKEKNSLIFQLEIFRRTLMK